MLIDWTYPRMECLAVREPNQPIYSEELSRFLTAQAALMDAQPVKTRALPLDAIENAPMPPEFQLMHPRRVRWSKFATAPDSQWTHMSGFTVATPEEEAWHRIHDPEGGLHPDDLTAYRKSQRGPVARFFAKLKFWR